MVEDSPLAGWFMAKVKKRRRTNLGASPSPSPLMRIEDSENRGGARTTMTYNGDGQRITRQTGSALTTFIWDGADYIQEKTS